MTRRERMEKRLANRRQWAEGRRKKASAAFGQAQSIISGIPFGQPILVGHHSEKRHRRTIDRMGAKMDSGCESFKMAEHHESRAAGIADQLSRTIFSDDPDAIDALQAKIEAARATVERMKAANKIVRKYKTDQTSGRKALESFGFSAAMAEQAFQPDFCGRIGFPSYELTNRGANIRRMQKRIEEIRASAARTERADESSGGILIEGGDYVRITFAEKPGRDVLSALKNAGFRWGGGCWSGCREKIPAGIATKADD